LSSKSGSRGLLKSIVGTAGPGISPAETFKTIAKVIANINEQTNMILLFTSLSHFRSTFTFMASSFRFFDIFFSLPLFKDKKHGNYDEPKTYQIIPPEIFFQIKDRKSREHYQGNNLLDGLQLSRGKLVTAYPISRHLEAILKEGDQPAR
jgi:hypothetical protein